MLLAGLDEGNSARGKWRGGGPDGLEQGGSERANWSDAPLETLAALRREFGEHFGVERDGAGRQIERREMGLEQRPLLKAEGDEVLWPR